MSGIQLFKDKLSDKKMGLLLWINVCITSLLLVISFIRTGKQLFLPQEELVFDASKRDFCSLVTKELINKSLSKKLMTESLYILVTENNYKALYFDGNESISGVWSGDDSCKVLVKTNNGLRSFDYFFDQSKDFNFFYQIKKIKENELYEKETAE